jgi:hypothetical protein
VVAEPIHPLELHRLAGARPPKDIDWDEVARKGGGIPLDDPPPNCSAIPVNPPFTAPRGEGEMAISNFTGQDAAVKLKLQFPYYRTAHYIYVHHGSTCTITGIGEGAYLVQFTTGKYWQRGAFLQGRAASQFGKAFNFTETRTDEGVEYREITVTLHAVPNGNIRKEAISDREFDRDL